MSVSRIIAVIPTYNPNQMLDTVVPALLRHIPVVLVDDGSAPAGRAIIEGLPRTTNFTVLRHEQNRGKGAALKTAFRHILAHHPDATGVVTLDADGQHLPEDALKIARQLAGGNGEDDEADDPDGDGSDNGGDGNVLLIGARRFTADVPWRSAFGNRLTRLVMRLRHGLVLSDTQTGLRGIPAQWLPDIIDIPFDRYELETEMLRLLKERGVRFKEIPIHTVYHEDNAHSHFRPLLDSMRIYWVLLRHGLSGVLAAVVDFAVYLIAFTLSSQILLSVSLGRLFSLLVNFSLLKTFAFRAPRHTALQFALYLLQVGIMALVASRLVSAAWTHLDITPEVSKIPVDILLYPVNFLIQKMVVFRVSGGLRRRED